MQAYAMTLRCSRLPATCNPTNRSPLLQSSSSPYFLILRFLATYREFCLAPLRSAKDEGLSAANRVLSTRWWHEVWLPILVGEIMLKVHSLLSTR